MSKLLGVAVILFVLTGCAAPSTTHRAGPDAPGGPAGSASPAVATSGSDAAPAANATTPAGNGTTTKPPVDLSGKPKPGVRVRMSLLATNLTGPVTFTVRGELNGIDRHPTTDTVTTNTTPEWHGTTSLAMAVPASGDLFSVAITLDVDHKVSNISSHTGVEATLPSPRPTADTNLPCKRVT